MKRSDPGSTASRAQLLMLASLCACSEDDGPTNGPTTVTGAVAVQWSYQGTDGTPLDCQTLGLSEAVVSVGGAPATRDCGDGESAVFSNLAAGQRTVAIEVQRIDGSSSLQHSGQIVVQPGLTVTYSHQFVEEPPPVGGDFAQLMLTWQIEDEPPETSCSRFGVRDVRARLTNGPGDAEDIDTRFACTLGSATLGDLRPGSYELRLDMLDANAEVLGVSNVVRMLALSAGANQRSTNFFFPLEGTLLAEWTVEGMDGACPPSTNVLALLLQDEQGGDEVETASVACSAGSLFFEQLPTPEEEQFRLTLTLRDLSVGTVILNQQSVGEIQLSASETATVTVDFDL